jgi:ubiquinone/menaquinone biosynthesis C-methylase UbiE
MDAVDFVAALTFVSEKRAALCIARRAHVDVDGRVECHRLAAGVDFEEVGLCHGFDAFRVRGARALSSRRLLGEMRPDLGEITEAFNARAASYAQTDWHVRCAERLIELCRLRPGDHVMDAATGTGFAALAAARAVGDGGRVLGVDISPGMLREARAAMQQAGLRNIELLEADAVRLPQLPDESFHVITCAQGLLYMPAADALREWYRLLKKRGRVAFTSMRTGSPPGARVFRDCAAAFAVWLRDPSEPLGSPAASRTALETAGFEVAVIVAETIEFTARDHARAWESNFRSAVHASVRRLGEDELRDLQSAYDAALAREESENPGALSRADILYVIGQR